MTTVGSNVAADSGICPECGRIQYLYEHRIDVERQMVKLYLACPVCAGECSEKIVEVQLVNQAMEDVVVRYAQALVQLNAAKKHVEERLALLRGAMTPQELANSIWAYHLLRQTVEEAWQQIPENQRQVLQPPAHYD